MKIQSALVLATAFGLISGACSTSPGTSPGGAAGAPASSGGAVGNAAGSPGNPGGGAIGSGGAPGGAGTVGTAGANASGGAPGGACTNVTACGGNVVGSWNVSSSCLKLSGALDVSKFGLDVLCMGTITGSLSVTGTWSSKADTTYVDGTTTTGDVKIEMSKECKTLSMAPVSCDGIATNFQGAFATAKCTDSAATGGCSCTATVQQKGSLGLISVDPQKSGNYATAANVLTADGTAPYSYCVAGNKLTISPTTTKPVTTGTIVLQNGSAGGGSGGAGSGGSGAGGAAGSGSAGMPGTAGAGGMVSTTQGPCDVYAAASPATPCAAAYSMIRRLNSKYSGPLYQVRNGSSAMNAGTGGMTKNIEIGADGFADTTAQDTFCAGSVCTVSILYDQSGNGNDLKRGPKGLSAGGTYATDDDFESSATKGAVTVGGHKVYSLYMAAREGYRLPAKGKGMPLGNSDQGIYMLADGTHYGTACCWDFGNVTTDPTQYHTMNTLFLGTGFWGKGAGNGPWFLGDFEGGVWAGGSGASSAVNSSNPSMKYPYALGMIKTSSMKYAIRVADLATAADLTTAYDGASPKAWDNQGGILLGIGADNSNNSWGTFYEGAITAGRPADATDLAVMKNIKAAGYGK